jgi:uncharacterized protein (DUF433 family)
MSVVTYAHIVQTPGTCGGRPRIDGHRIRVQDIAVAHVLQAMTAEEICRQYPGVTAAEVHSALAFFYDHRIEIEADIQSDKRAVTEFQQTHPHSAR